MSNTVNNFLQTISSLRMLEELIVFGKMEIIPESDYKDVITFLEEEYLEESTGFPMNVPAFNAEAALWGAKTIYAAACVLLDRNQNNNELDLLFPPYAGNIEAGSILSVDLCLRFLPPILFQLKRIDVEDEAIMLLENILATWHYSGINYQLNYSKINFTTISDNVCMYQLYCDRIIQFKNLELAQLPVFNSHIKGCLGLHTHIFWNELKTANKINEQSNQSE